LDEDAALLPRLRAGEEAAFRELVRRHHTRLVRLAGAFTGGRARAEEAVQDAWVVVPPAASTATLAKRRSAPGSPASS
jgi:DNA-directed RNA polymerase specialized sigma24 family protein